MSISLNKISLEKKGDSHKISLTKSPSKQSSNDDIININLNWTQPEIPPKRSGFFGAILDALVPIPGLDLDLGALIELNDGHKSVIQPLGQVLGNLHASPYIEHSGDDRTGENASGENIRIKLENWKYFKRICVFTYIYEGAADWATANGVVEVKIPNQPTLVVEMGKHEEKARLCAICMLENDDNDIKVTKLVSFHDGSKTGTWQNDLDVAYNWGMNWQRTRK